MFIPLVAERRKGIRWDLVVAIERHSLSEDGVLRRQDGRGWFYSTATVYFHHDQYFPVAPRTLKRLWESWERTAWRRSSVWGSGTVSIPAPSNSFLSRAAYATASGGGDEHTHRVWFDVVLGSTTNLFTIHATILLHVLSVHISICFTFCHFVLFSRVFFFSIFFSIFFQGSLKRNDLDCLSWINMITNQPIRSFSGVVKWPCQVQSVYK